MRLHKYKVIFKNPQVQSTEIHAGCEEEAKILAQAVKINAGQDYRVSAVIKL